MNSELPKYLKQLIKNLRWPLLLVLTGKHDSGYFLISGPDDLWKASLEILRERVEVEQYISAPELYGLQEGELSKEEIDKLPEPYKKQALSIAARNKKVHAEHQRDMEEWENVQRALREQDGVLAFEILRGRKDHEYEGFEFETLRIPGTEENDREEIAQS